MSAAERAKRPRIVVVGSINMDVVVRTAHLPRPGETLHARDLAYSPGGKGANQAVAAARLGAESLMVGRVGDDGAASELRRSLEAHGVLAEHVLGTNNCPSGTALIHVDDAGENSITIVAGANGRLSPADIEQLEPVIRSADAVLLQLEVPLETVAATIQLAREHQVLTILDPAPAPKGGLPAELYQADLISPNQTEAELLTGIAVHTVEEARRASDVLLARGARFVAVKLAAQGCYAADGSSGRHIASWAVEVVDSTAAGDAFTAGLAVSWTEGRSLWDAVRFGCAAGALAATRPGAQAAMPTRNEVDQLLQTKQPER